MRIKANRLVFIKLGLVLFGATSLFGVNYSPPTVSYVQVPMSGGYWGTFVGEAAWAPQGWYLTIKSGLSGKIRTRAAENHANCHVAYIENSPTFTFSGHVNLPAVDTETNQMPKRWIYQEFVHAVAVHEYWHVDIHKAYADGAWASFEFWLSTYESEPCLTAQKAKENAEADLISAITKIEETTALYRSKFEIGHPKPVTVTYHPPDETHSKTYVKFHNANWGRNAYDAVAAITVSFAAPTSGEECTCTPPTPDP